MQTTLDHLSTPIQWWRSRKKHFNIGLILGAAFLLLMSGLIYSLSSRTVPITASEVSQYFTLLAFAYAFYILIANLAYSLGSWIDRKFNTHNSVRFREDLFTLGYWLTVCFPGMLVLCIANFLLI
jgi:hypothetical protein